jgi:AcrR family transcriptional regulator
VPRARKPRISVRKPPSQERSRQLVAAILEAAIRVLRKHGARRFTTIRVAQEAGVSVGSLYQYFPNKESILFRLQADEWEATWQALRAELFAEHRRPFERLRRAVLFFFRSEADEAELRVALDDAHALIRGAEEAWHLQRRGVADMERFVAEVAPRAGPKARAFAAEFVFTALGAIAEKVTEARPDEAELRAYAEATAEMLAGYLRGLR